jgi:hypothetical protein
LSVFLFVCFVVRYACICSLLFSFTQLVRSLCV